MVKGYTLKRDQKQKSLIEIETYCRSLETQTAEVQKHTEEKMKALSLQLSKVEQVNFKVFCTV
jgi:hypothetical protein